MKLLESMMRPSYIGITRASQARETGSTPVGRSIKMKEKAVFPLIFYLLTFCGCATAPSFMPSRPAGVPGFYHSVQRGQTLWSISRIYNIDLEELSKINRITDASRIENGQLIFVPRAKETITAIAHPAGEDFIWPLNGKVISTFGQTFDNMINKGINIQARKGQDVVASRSGKVVFSALNFDGYGKTIIIDHGDGFRTVYTRNEEIFVKAGDNVERGALVGKAGSAGRNKGIFLHFEIRKGQLPQNPYFYLP